MVQAVIRALIFICVLALCVVLVVWVLGVLGLAIPPMVIKILYVIAMLVAILILYRLLSPHIGGFLP